MIQFYSNNATDLQRLTSYSIRRVASKLRNHVVNTITATTLHPMYRARQLYRNISMLFPVAYLFSCCLPYTDHTRPSVYTACSRQCICTRSCTPPRIRPCSRPRSPPVHGRYGRVHSLGLYRVAYTFVYTGRVHV